MYKVVYWRYGQKHVVEFETIADAHKEFNFIGYYENGFSECILDEQNRILRDGKEGVFGIKKENRIGSIYSFS